MKKKIAVLGATGSIGKNAMDVIRRGNFEPVLLTANTNINALLNLKNEFPNALLALTGTEKAPETVDYYGPAELPEAIAECGAEIFINGISGSAGLEPSMAVLDTGSRLLLANKETMVMAGHLALAREKEKNAKIIPVDSEHTAIFLLKEAYGLENIDEIILTASGGPFRNFSMDDLARVTPAQALAHPNWNMGPKITVESATLANKGLEVIEASRLFGLQPEKIRVLIHPQSIVHSMVRLKDGMFYAQMSKPDMRHPIHACLYWPDVVKSGLDVLDFEGLSLTFGKPDMERFPMLLLAYKALEKGPLYPAVYNAANEAAVEAFLEGRISFLEIPRIVGYVLNYKGWTMETDNFPGLAKILDTDRKARKMAFEMIGSKL